MTKARKGTVVIQSVKDRIRLCWSHCGQRYYLSVGLEDTPTNRKVAELRARQIELDVRCLAYLESLPEFALEDAVVEIEKIADFYCDRVPPKPSIRTPVVKGKLTTPKIRPPIILDR